MAPAEVALLAAYFQVSLDAFCSRARQQLRIAVVYRHGKIEGHLLRGQMEAALPGVGSVTAIHQDALATINEQDYDLAIAPSQQLVIGGKRYPITAVGEVAQKNLGALGHISLVFNGSTEAEMGGTVYVDLAGQPFSTLGENGTIAVEA